MVQETIQRDNKFYIIEQTPDESREIYLNRVKYIIDKLANKDLNQDIYQKTITLSLIWRNINFYKMSYPFEIMKQINI
jgi:hypothetical protein